MPALEIHLFGKFKMTCGEQEQVKFYAHKAQVLFCYLLLYRQRAHRRDFLSDLLWGENDSSMSRKYLRKALWQLQVGLDSLPEPRKRSLLVVNPDRVQINPLTEISLDLQTFEQTHTSLQAANGANLSNSDFQRLQSTLTLYTGELLEGWDAEWCLYEREHYKNKFLSLVDKLMEHYEVNGDYQSGIEYGSRALQCDPACELTHWRLMRLYFLSGNRTASIRQFETCRQSLKADLNIEPGEKTRALFSQITSNQTDKPTCEILGRIDAPKPQSDLIDALNRINVLVEMQSTIQRQLMEQLASIEFSLKSLK